MKSAGCSMAQQGVVWLSRVQEDLAGAIRVQQVAGGSNGVQQVHHSATCFSILQ